MQITVQKQNIVVGAVAMLREEFAILRPNITALFPTGLVLSFNWRGLFASDGMNQIEIEEPETLANALAQEWANQTKLIADLDALRNPPDEEATQ